MGKKIVKFFFMDLLGCCGFCVGIESLNSHDFPLIIFVHKIVISEIFVVYKIYSNNVHTILHVCLDCIENGRHARLRFFVWVPCIVYETLSMDFNKFFFKIESHGTIHTFKNYFTTIFSVFSNKKYPNRLYVRTLHVSDTSIIIGLIRIKSMFRCFRNHDFELNVSRN